MEDEKIVHLKELGNTVVRIRKELNKSQIEFYRYLFPDDNVTDELIKKKMNAIENGKRKNIDIEFLNAIASKCNCGLDYLFGLKKDYKSYTNEFLCNYFGLCEDAIEGLRKIAVDKEIDIHSHPRDKDGNIKSYSSQQHMDTEFAIIFSHLFNYLFKKEQIPEGSYLSKLSIFYFLYNYIICDAKIKHEDLSNFYYKNNPDEYTYLIDSDNHIYGINANDILLEINSKKIIKVLDEIRERYHKTKA